METKSNTIHCEKCGNDIAAVRFHKHVKKAHKGMASFVHKKASKPSNKRDLKALLKMSLKLEAMYRNVMLICDEIRAVVSPIID